VRLLTLILISLSLFLFIGCNNTAIAIVNEQYTGYQFNAWNNTLTGVNGLSNIIDTKNNPHISIMIQSSGLTTYEVHVSENCIDFILCEDLSAKLNAPSGYTSHIFFTAGARCYQLQSSNNVVMNATIVAKK